jgi:pimeloyl-ACP methyl ester carboxylesterase
VVTPVYAGDDVGYTDAQARAFDGMDAVASRAGVEGVEVLRTMYFEQLPEAVAERAWEVAADFDAGSVVATSRFIASGIQPFGTARELRSIRVPTLLVRGDDAIHPPEVSDVYAASIDGCSVVPAGPTDPARTIGEFCDSVVMVSSREER